MCDFGTKTGLVGQELFHRGFENIFGIDKEQHMLDAATKKHVYHGL